MVYPIACLSVSYRSVGRLCGAFFYRSKYTTIDTLIFLSCKALLLKFDERNNITIQKRITYSIGFIAEKAAQTSLTVTPIFSIAFRNTSWRLTWAWQPAREVACAKSRLKNKRCRYLLVFSIDNCLCFFSSFVYIFSLHLMQIWISIFKSTCNGKIA